MRRVLNEDVSRLSTVDPNYIKKLRDITIFVTEEDSFSFKRLMFGINCALEMFQRIMRLILETCEGAISFIDDVIVNGRTKEELEVQTKANAKKVSLAQMLFERKLKIKLQKLSKNIIYLLIRKNKRKTKKKVFLLYEQFFRTGNTYRIRTL
ncbi:hypothetical protein HZH68_001123 [Vespula germanica]|uniref:Reverse transcriptase domain-containing protein n=1 Tax=Vespula germanica TaxID=30212 RepID=A0A834U6P0_VESGE|nr:hypothetical protein HZH68_001123 [Vespula germanica]